MTAVPQGSGRRSLRALVADNPAAILTFVFIGIFVATDIVNRAQGDGAFLTAKQVSTTFLFAAVLGLIAAGQTQDMGKAHGRANGHDKLLVAQRRQEDADDRGESILDLGRAGSDRPQEHRGHEQHQPHVHASEDRVDGGGDDEKAQA